MSTKRKASLVKRRQSMVVEKLSDNSNNSSNSEKEKPIKSPRKNIRSKHKKDLQEESPPERKINNFPTKNIFNPELFVKSIENIERFKCGLCECICEEPRYQYCGCQQIYCKKCLDFYYEAYNNQCPNCQKETKELKPSEEFFETLMNLKMKCYNCINGCKWIGLYKDYKEHIYEKCQKEIINCPNKDCVIKLPREEMLIHKQNCEYRIYICRECLNKMEYFHKKSHKNYCPKAKIICPQGCGEYINREDVSSHKIVCQNSEMSCPFKIFGCKDKFSRNEKDSRLKRDIQKHLNLTAKVAFELNDKVKSLEKIIEDMKKEINDINKNIKNNKKNEINNNQDKINNIHEEENIIMDGINNNDNHKEMKFLEKKREASEEIPENITPQNNNNFSIFEGDLKAINLSNNNNDINFSLNKNIFEAPTIYEVSSDCKHLFHLNNDIIETINLNELKHYFVFFNKKYDIPKDSPYLYSFAVKLLTPCKWLAIGICDKKIVEENNFQFDSYKKINGKRNLGIYCINVNQVIYNCNAGNQFIKMKYDSSISLTSKGATISCSVNPKNYTIDFFLNNEYFHPLTNVKCFKSDFFSPFLIFLKNCRIQTIFNYK